MYTIYKGDDLITTGTKQECAEALNVKQSTIELWATPSNGTMSRQQAFGGLFK